MEALSDRIKRITESQTLEMAQLSRELKEKGHDIIDLTVGQPDFPTPEHIKLAAKNAIDNDFTFYTPVQGYKDLIEAIIHKFKVENGVEYKPENILVSNGAKQSLANVILTLIDVGSEIIIPVPYWVTYKELDNLAHGQNVFIKTSFENNYKVTAQQIKDAITPRTRVLLYSSPSNPAGTVYSKDELKAIAEIIAEHPNIYIISDEIYEHLNYNGEHQSISQFDFIKNQLIVINGVSKAYAMTGWRIGYMAAPEWITKQCRKLQGQYTSNACSVSQKASVAALLGGNDCIEFMRKDLLHRRDVSLDELSKIPNIRFVRPQGAFYVFPELSQYYGKSNGLGIINNSKDLALYLLEKAHVAVVPGSAFGMDECIRISYVVGESKLREAFKRLKEALKNLQ